MGEKHFRPAWWLVLSLATSIARGGDSHGHAEFVIGRSATGQLIVEFNFKESVLLPPIEGLLNGWGADEPGFVSLAKDEPAEGIFTLADGAVVALQVVSFDTAFRGITPGFASVFRNPGDTWVIGEPALDEHGFWHINSDDPAFDPNQMEWRASFRLIDMGATGYAATNELTVRFTNVPEPASFVFMALAAMALAWKRARPVADFRNRA